MEPGKMYARIVASNYTRWYAKNIARNYAILYAKSTQDIIKKVCTKSKKEQCREAFKSRRNVLVKNVRKTSVKEQGNKECRESSG